MILQKSSREMSRPLLAALCSISSSSEPFMVSPSSFATLLMLLMLINPVLSSSNRSKIRLMPLRVSLSPSFEVMASRNSSKSISLPSLSRSAIMLKMVGFLDSNPRLCMADFSSRGSILPVASVSNRLKASLSSSTSSSVRPGLSTFFLAGPLAGAGLRVAISNLILQLQQILPRASEYSAGFQTTRYHIIIPSCPRQAWAPTIWA